MFILWTDVVHGVVVVVVVSLSFKSQELTVNSLLGCHTLIFLINWLQEFGFYHENIIYLITMSILIPELLDNVWILRREVRSQSLLGVKRLNCRLVGRCATPNWATKPHNGSETNFEGSSFLWRNLIKLLFALVYPTGNKRLYRKESHYQKKCLCLTPLRIPQLDADSIEDQQGVRLLNSNNNTSSCLENSNRVRVEKEVYALLKVFIFFKSVGCNKRLKISNMRITVFFFVRTTITLPQDGLHPEGGSNNVQMTFLSGMCSKIVRIK